MSYGGRVLDMINRIKQNRDLFETRKNKLKKFKSILFIPIIFIKQTKNVL